MTKKSKKTELAETDLLENYYVIYEEEDEDLLILAGGFNYKVAVRILSKHVVRLCAYLLVEDDQESQNRFRKIAGRQVTRADVERWLIASLVSEADIGLVASSTMKDGSPLGVQGFPKIFAPELTNLIDEDEENDRRVESVFQELDNVAKANKDVITKKANELLSTIISSMKGSIYFRFRAMLIQLLSEGFMKSFPQPVAPEFVRLVETGLMPSLIAELIHTRGKGKPRGSGRRFDSKAEFLRKLRVTIRALKEQEESVTQESVSKAMSCNDSQLRVWLREFGISWKREKAVE